MPEIPSVSPASSPAAGGSAYPTDTTRGSAYPTGAAPGPAYPRHAAADSTGTEDSSARAEGAGPDSTDAQSTSPDPEGAGAESSPAVTVPAAVAARASWTATDLTKALAVLLIPVFALVALYVVVFNGDRPIAVDPSDTLDAARHGAAFTVLEPSNLPAGWTTTSSVYGPVEGGSILRLGYVGPGHAAVQLIESDQPTSTLIPAQVGASAQPAGLVDLGGQAWHWYPAARDGDSALVRLDPGRTVIVIGTGPTALRTLASSLRVASSNGG